MRDGGNLKLDDSLLKIAMSWSGRDSKSSRDLWVSFVILNGRWVLTPMLNGQMHDDNSQRFGQHGIGQLGGDEISIQGAECGNFLSKKDEDSSQRGLQLDEDNLHIIVTIVMKFSGR